MSRNKNKKLSIRIIFGCGKEVIKDFTTRKGVENEYQRLVNTDKIYDGHKYTSDFKFERFTPN